MKSYLAASLLAITSAASFEAGAVPITYTASGTGPGGVAVSASSVFDLTGNTLTITLQNTSPSNSGQDVPGSTLTGLFFDLTGNPLLNPFSATVGAESSIVGTCDNIITCVGVTNVGGEFGYQATALTGGADRGISSSGYLSTGLAGNIGNFNNGAAGTDLDTPESLDGVNFGLISAASGFNPNGGLEGEPVIKDAVVFVLTGVSLSDLTIADISHVSFQYGAGLSDLNIPGTDPGILITPAAIPEPATVALLGLGMLGIGASRRRRQ